MQLLNHEIESRIPKTRWTVLRTNSKRAHRILAEAQGLDVGGWLPTYRRVHFPGGQLSRTERQLLPGYLFVKMCEEDHARISAIDGVYGVLAAGERGLARLDRELAPLQFDAHMGRWDDVEPAPSERRRRRRRRPRAGKRASRPSVAA